MRVIKNPGCTDTNGGGDTDELRVDVEDVGHEEAGIHPGHLIRNAGDAINAAHSGQAIQTSTTNSQHRPPRGRRVIGGRIDKRIEAQKAIPTGLVATDATLTSRHLS